MDPDCIVLGQAVGALKPDKEAIGKVSYSVQGGIAKGPKGSQSH